MFKFKYIVLGILFTTGLFAETLPIAYPNCQNPTHSEFQQTLLVSHNTVSGANASTEFSRQLIRMDLLYNENANDYDIFFGGFEGKLVRYNAEDSSISVIKDFETINGNLDDPYGRGDHGLTGILFHPNFKNNRWIFTFYTPKDSLATHDDDRVMFLTRWELDTNFDLQNEKVLLKIRATTTDRWHSGGSMDFDASGDLWLQVGDNVGADNGARVKNSNAAWASGGTTNLLGASIRIHPDSSDMGYSIPSGNFGEHFSAHFSTVETLHKSIQINYLDTNRVRAQIYAKGQRSNFTSAIHPVEEIFIWGEVNTGNVHDEINLVTDPVFGGWPFFQGSATNNRAGGSNNRYIYDVTTYPNLESPPEVVNDNILDDNDVRILPKPFFAQIVNLYNVVSVGGLYFYGQGDSVWTNRTFPPHFHETFYASNTGNGMSLIPIRRDSKKKPTINRNDAYSINNLFTNNGNGNGNFGGFNSRMFYGPDGALYILGRGGSYGAFNNIKSRIIRVDYTGNCHDQTFFDANKTLVKKKRDSGSDPARYRFLEESLYTGGPTKTLSSQRVSSLVPNQQLTAKVYNIQGQLINIFSSNVSSQGNVTHWNGSLQNGRTIQNGVYFIQYSNLSGQKVLQRKQIF